MNEDAREPVGSARNPRRRRLSRSVEFERVYRQGRSKGNRYLVLYAFPRDEQSGSPHENDLAGSRLGVSVSRRVGGAVIRTRVKRALRQAFWAEGPRLSERSDYVIVARAEAASLVEREGTMGVRAALAQLVDELGGRPGAPAEGSGSG